MDRTARDGLAPAWWRGLEWAPWELELEPVRAEDAGRVARALTAEIAGWLGIGSVERMREGTPVWAGETEELARSRQAYRYVINRSEKFAGVIELRPDATRGHIGYWLRRSARGRGTMTLANALLLRVAFEGLRLKAVDWVADAANAPSIAVMERLGARRIACYATPTQTRREFEARYRLTRRAFTPPPDGPPSLHSLLT